jgi:hypothetical protein
MASGESIAAWVDGETKREVENYQERRDHEFLSTAAAELIEIGLRESSNPVVYRLKDRVVEWVSLLGIASVIVFLAGATTGVMAVTDAAKLSVALVGAAIVLLGIFELARVALGMNELGSAVREVLGGEQA